MKSLRKGCLIMLILVCMLLAACSSTAQLSRADREAAQYIDLSGEWNFKLYRKWDNMYQYFPYTGVNVTWEDAEAALVPEQATYEAWETVLGPNPDYSTGGLLQMYRSGTGEDNRSTLSENDLFPKWAEAWWCKTVNIPAGFLTEDTVTLLLGIIDDMDIVYINGTPVAQSGFVKADGSKADPAAVPENGGFVPAGDFKFEKSYWEVSRVYEIPSSLFHEGENSIQIRIYNNNSFGGFYDRTIALCGTQAAARALQGLPINPMTDTTAAAALVAKQVAALQAEDIASYAATLDAGYQENELNQEKQLAVIQGWFDAYDQITVTDADSGFYTEDGQNFYTAERVITGVGADGKTATLFSNDKYVKYLTADCSAEFGNHSRCYSVTYTSALPAMNGKSLVYSVYLPESYYENPEKEYPVVYLLHGINSTGQSFVNVDRVNEKFDQWITENEMADMIVIMPDSGKSSWYKDTEGAPSDSAGPWESHITIDILAQVEDNYRVLSDSKFRALTGISMGGGGVFSIGMANTDKYSSFASHMGAVQSAVDQISALSDDQLKALSFYLDCGYDDQMVQPQWTEDTAKYLESLGADVTWELRDGAHNSAFYMAGMLNSMKVHSKHFIENGYQDI